MNRRDLIVGAGVAISGGALAQDIPFTAWTAGPEKKDVSLSYHPEFTVQKYIELPLRPGDEIVAMTTFRDELIVATKRGEIFRLQPTDF